MRQSSLTSNLPATIVLAGMSLPHPPMPHTSGTRTKAASGEVVWSGVVARGAANPDWSAFVPAPVAVSADTTGSRPASTTGRGNPRKKPTIPLAIAAGGAAAASGILLGLAANSRAEFDDPATPLSDVEALAGTTNALGYSGIGAGVLALGLGAVAVVTVAW